MTASWNIGGLLRDLALRDRHPAVIAFAVEGSETWDSATVADKALRLARRLRDTGVGTGKRVALWAPNSPVWIVGALVPACAMLPTSGRTSRRTALREPDTTTNRKNARDPRGRRRGARMRRRELLLMVMAGMMGHRAVHAQQNAMPVIGFLGVTREDTGFMGPVPPGFARDRLYRRKQCGDGVPRGAVSIRSTAHLGRRSRQPQGDLIVTTNTPTALAAKSATSTIPIVFTYVSDPVGMGLVAGLARPGGNLTGFSNIAAELIPKGIELICELVPQAGVIALLVNQNSANAANVIRHAQEAARAKGVQLAVLNAGTEREVDAAFASLVQLQAGALVVDPDGFFNSRRRNSWGWRRAMLCRRCIRAASS